MSDLENELLGLAEDDPKRRSKKRRGESSRSKPKPSAYVDDSEEELEDEGEEEMDMDIDSGSDEEKPVAPIRSRPAAQRNPYPLEGKYIDEDDRDRLDALPEMERETILAARLEEMQKFGESQQLDAMYKMAGMGAEASDDDGPRAKRRKHTSVTKEAYKAMDVLKTRRKTQDERAQRRALRPQRRASPGSEDESEEGEVGRFDSYRRSSSPERPARSPVRKYDKDTERDLDTQPAERAELNSARVSRYELVEMLYKDQFEDVITGAYVRLMAGEPDQYGRPKYRIHKISSVETDSKFGRYKIEYKGKDIVDNRVLMCQYGSAKRMFRIADVSNGDIEETEFQRFVMTNQADKVKAPKRSELKKKHEQIRALRDRPMTNEEINRQVESRKQSNPLAQRNQALFEISNLISTRNLALRRNDTESAERINRDIVALGGDPTTGELVTVDADEAARNASDYDAKIQRINENNKRRTKEAMAAAHAASLQRKKLEEAIIKAKTESASAEASPAPVALPQPVIPSLSSLKKGETTQAAVAKTIDISLDDF
ncbi:hypothetical protein BCR39DRAFT_541580 [Naematelia encephala]|uniref:Plus3 domain-containing protein n=1 Tax=Naematelia encephala TaxID=71784 RepID=A0A1Y2AUH0_9TREE|nr:hypothetical protein BCR39DRAFT_541580 [Naematelia encephala]